LIQLVRIAKAQNSLLDQLGSLASIINENIDIFSNGNALSLQILIKRLLVKPTLVDNDFFEEY
jgi:hypothetical protein